MTPLKNRPRGEGLAHPEKTITHDRWYDAALGYAYIHGDKIALAAWLAALLVLEMLA